MIESDSTMSDIKVRDKAYVADTYARFDVAITSGIGSELYDENDKISRRYKSVGTPYKTVLLGVDGKAYFF